MSDIVGKKVKLAQFKVGVDLLGSKLSLAANAGTELTLTEQGVLALSKTTGRLVLIPFENLKGIEMLQENPEITVPRKSKILKN
jgi:hypothetical protein